MARRWAWRRSTTEAASRWPGVPQDLPGAVAVFERIGWAFERVSVDMVRELSDYLTSRGIPARVLPLGLEIQPVGADGREAVLAFEDRHFPNWSRSFRQPEAEILAASTAREGIVAALLVEGPAPTAMYAPMLGPDMGEISCVGVAEAHQGRGVGTAMVAKASELLRGVRRCHIRWTERERFYGRLGYRRWRAYLCPADAWVSIGAGFLTNVSPCASRFGGVGGGFAGPTAG